MSDLSNQLVFYNSLSDLESISDPNNRIALGLLGYMPQPRQIRDPNAANEVFYMPDYHGNLEGLITGVTKLGSRHKGKTNYVILGDIMDRKDIMQDAANDPDIRFSDQVVNKHLSGKVSNDELNAYQFYNGIEANGGVENYIAVLTENGMQFDENQLRSDYNKAREILDEKVDGVDRKTNIESILNGREFNRDLVDSEFNLKAYDRANARYIARRLANGVLDVLTGTNGREKVDLKLIVGAGNHDYLSDYAAIVKEFNIAKRERGLESSLPDGQDVFICANDVHGMIELGSGEETLRFQYGSNCHAVPPLTNQAFQREGQLLQPHMYDGSFMPGFDISQLDQVDINQLYNVSPDLVRMLGLAVEGTDGYDNSLNDQADFLLLHQQWGPDVKGYEHGTRLENTITNVGVLKYGSMFVKKNSKGDIRLYCGHFHADGVENRWGADIYRHQATIIGKNGHEVLNFGRRSKRDIDKSEIDFLRRQEFKYLSQLYDLKGIYESIDKMSAANDDSDDRAAA